jgi:predicted nucleotidyltransferase
MHRIIDDNLTAIRGLCEQHRVQSLHLFGSAAGDDFDAASSDLDFLVEFRSMEPGDLAAAYLGLLEDLEKLFAQRIDLVVSRAIENPYFQEAVDAGKVSIYAAA